MAQRMLSNKERFRMLQILSYDETWISLFKAEAEALKLLFAENLIAIHHIGSTSIPGLAAKPIIDIMAIVKEIGVVDSLEELLSAQDYQGLGEYGIPGRRFFRKGGQDRRYHLHVFQQDNPEIKRHLTFRDFMRQHPQLVKEYSQLKQQTAEDAPYDLQGYSSMKDQFIDRINKMAIQEIENKES